LLGELVVGLSSDGLSYSVQRTARIVQRNGDVVTALFVDLTEELSRTASLLSSVVEVTVAARVGVEVIDLGATAALFAESVSATTAAAVN